MNENTISTGRSIRLSDVCLLATMASFVFLAVPTLAEPPSGSDWVTAAGHPAEDKIDSLLGRPKLEMQQVFQGEV